MRSKRLISTLGIFVIIVLLVAGVAALIYSLQYVKRTSKVMPPELVAASGEFEAVYSGQELQYVNLTKISFTIKNPLSRDIVITSIYVDGFGAIDLSKASVEVGPVGSYDNVRHVIIVKANSEATVNIDMTSSPIKRSAADLQAHGISIEDLKDGVGPVLRVTTDVGVVSTQIQSVVVSTSISGQGTGTGQSM